MKTVRLRKVSASDPTHPGASSASISSVTRDSSLQQSSILRGRDTSLRSLEAEELDARTGEKRKRAVNGAIDFRDLLSTFCFLVLVPDLIPLLYKEGASKRRSMPQGSLSSSFSSNPTLAESSSSSQSYASSSRTHPANRTWPSMSATETERTTPSLCSDNEAEREDQTNTDDILSTPIDTTRTANKDDGRPATTRKEIIDIDMEAEFERIPTIYPPIPSATVAPASPQTRRLNDLFAKRPPTSPMPDDSPRKPRPPARSKYTARTKAHQDYGSDEEDFLLFRKDVLRDKANRPIPPEGDIPSGRNCSRRRQTLDEELQEANERSRAEDELDLDSGVLVGVGTRSRRTQFLAHGGAGGVPVVMGADKIEGAEKEGQVEQEDVRQPRKKKSPKQLMNKRKARR